MVDFERFWLQSGTPNSPGPRGVLQGRCQQKPLGLGSIPLHLRGRAPSGRHGGGSRPALPGLHDVLCRSRSSGSVGLRVAVVEPSAKTFAFRFRVDGFCIQGSGFRVPESRFRGLGRNVQGFGVFDLGFRGVWIQGFGVLDLRVLDLGFGFEGLWI